MLEIIIQQATVPVVVDAGIGVPSHAAQAWKWGRRGVGEYGDCRRGRSRQHGEGISSGGRSGLLARQSDQGSRSHLLSCHHPLAGFLEASA